MVKFNGMLYHDPIVLVIPPLGNLETDFPYYPPTDKPCLLFFLQPGGCKEYDPSTGAIGAELRTVDAGFRHWHTGYMKYHTDPFLEHFLRHNPYQFVGWVVPGKPHWLRVFNRTNKYIWFDCTVWLAEFPSFRVILGGEEVELEEAFRTYLSGYFDFFYKIGRGESK